MWRGAELLFDDVGRQLGAHRRGVLLQVGQGGAEGLGETIADIAGDLAHLHEGTLHVAQGVGHIGRRPELEALLGGPPAVGRGEDEAGPVGQEVEPGTGAEEHELDASFESGGRPHRLRRCHAVISRRRSCSLSCSGEGLIAAPCTAMILLMSPSIRSWPPMNACIAACGLPSTNIERATS